VRWAGLADFCRTFSTLIAQNLPSNVALATTADCLQNAEYSDAARDAIDQMAKGRSLGESLANRPSIPRGFLPFITWATEQRGLSQALRLAGELYATRAMAQARFLSRFTTSVLFALVVWTISLAMFGLLAPLLSLLNGLSGTPFPSSASAGLEEWWESMKTTGVPTMTVILALVVLIVALTWKHWSAFLSAGLGGLLAATRGRRFGVRHLMFAVVIAALLFVAMRELGLEFAGVLLAIAPVTIIAAIAQRLLRRSAQQEALTRVLALAAIEKLPLAPAVRVFGPLCEGAHRRDVEGLASRLEAGASLADAIRARPRALPREVGLIARVGDGSNALGPALEQALQTIEANREQTDARTQSKIYHFFVLGCVFAAAGFGTLGVAPSMASIMRDFQAGDRSPVLLWFANMRPPEIPNLGGIFLSGTSSAFHILIYLLVVFAIYTIIVIAIRFTVRGLWRIFPFRPVRRADRITLQRSLSAGLEGGDSLPDILGKLAKTHPDRRLRRRIAAARAGVERGDPWRDRLQRAGILTATDGMLMDAAAKLNNVPWALRAAADASQRRLFASQRVWARFTSIATTLVLGGLVLGYALLYFQPLVALIQAIEESIK
jgi:type II secretory pathway component PulF